MRFAFANDYFGKVLLFSFLIYDQTQPQRGIYK